MSEAPDRTFVDRLSRQGEEALGRIAEELIANPVVNRAITGAFEARDRAVQAQEAAMGALNIPSAADVERLTRRLRSVSQRLEGIEDALDRLEVKAGKAVEAAGSEDSERPGRATRRDRPRPVRAARGSGPRRRSRAAGPGAPDGHRGAGELSAAKPVWPSRTPAA